MPSLRLTAMRLVLASSLCFSATAFMAQQPATVRMPGGTSLAYSVHDEEKPIQCFIVYGDDINLSRKHNKKKRRRGKHDLKADLEDLEPEIPKVVCTSNPDEYAWFNGIKPDQLVPTEIVHAARLESCEEGASPRGVPEWVAESAFL